MFPDRLWSTLGALYCGYQMLFSGSSVERSWVCPDYAWLELQLRSPMLLALRQPMTCLKDATEARLLLNNWMLHFKPCNLSEQRNILHEIRKRKANWIGHILHRNCLLKHVIEGKIKGEMEVARRRGRRRKKLLDDLKDRRGYSHLNKEALDRTMWRHRFGGGFGPVVRQNTEWMNEC